MKFKNIWLFLIVGLVAAAGIVATIALSENDKVDFSWNSVLERNIEDFGVDSSALRTELGYVVDANSYQPLYVNESLGCRVITAFNAVGSSSVDEKVRTSEALAQRLGIPTQALKERFVSFDNEEDIVPVMTGMVESAAGFSRYFQQEDLILTVVVECSDSGTLQSVFSAVMKAFRIVSNGSVY